MARRPSRRPACLAVAAAAAQAAWLKEPAAHIPAYLGLWIGVAAVSVALIGFEMVTRSRRMHSDLAGEMIRAAVEQFLPAGVAGVLVTAMLCRFAPHSLGLLPGLWQIIFGLGVFASCRFLPRAMVMVGVWYLAAGLTALAYSADARAFSPWIMGAGFGIGQGLVALVLQRGVGGGDE